MNEVVGASVEGTSGAGGELVGVTTKVSVISTMESSEIEVVGAMTNSLVEMLADVWGRTIVKIIYTLLT